MQSLTLTVATFLLVAGCSSTEFRDYKGRTPLHHCSNAEYARILIQEGADTNARDEYGRTPLHECRNAGVARVLIENNANPKARSYRGETPLHKSYSVEVARLLIEEDADVNAVDRSGNTPLHSCGSVETASLLIEKGANPNARNAEGNTPLHTCVDEDICHLLLRKGAHVKKFGALNNDGESALHLAASKGNFEVVKVLLEHGSDLHKADCRGRTPMHAACDYPWSNIRVVQLLLERGANVMARDKDGRIPLHIAVRNAIGSKNDDDVLVPKILIERLSGQGFNIDTTDNEGWTALHHAVVGCGIICTKLLLDKRANMNAANNEGKTPWYFAIIKDSERRDEMVQLMIDHGADVATNFFDGSTPLHLAARSSAYYVRSILRAIDILINRLAVAGADIDLLDAKGKTPLLVAMGEPDKNELDHIPGGWQSCSSHHVGVLLARGASIEQVYWINSTVIDEFYRRCDEHIRLPIRAELGQVPAEIAFSIKSHINSLLNKLSAAELSFSLDDFVPDVVEEYWAEIERLKSSVIYGMMSFYKFLHEDDPFVASKILKSSYGIANLPVEFPAYGNLLKAKLKMDSFRTKLISSASKQLSLYIVKITQQSKIPDDIIDTILLRLTCSELVEFIQSKESVKILEIFKTMRIK